MPILIGGSPATPTQLANLRQDLGVVTGAGVSPLLGIPDNPDFVIDAANGNDSNAGTPAAPWRTLSKLASAVTLGAKKTVLIKAGTYATVLDTVSFGPTNVYPARTELVIAFERGCICDGTAANASGPTANAGCLDFSGALWVTRVYGNGVIIRNYSDGTDGTTSSPNGVSNRGTNTLYLYDAIIQNCDDGISAHDQSRMFTFRCDVGQGQKSAFAHVATAYWEDVGSTFRGLTGTANGSTGKVRCVGTKFMAAEGSGTAVQLTFSGAVRLERCQIGSETQQLRIAHVTAGSRVDLVDCYINSFIDGRDNAYLTRCYGRFYTRIRSGSTAGGLGGKQCVFVGPSTQADVAGGGVSYQLDLGASAMSWDDCIWFGYGVAFGAAFTAGADTYWNGSSSVVRNNCFFGNTTNIRAGLTGFSGTLTVDPQIGAATGYTQRDYALMNGSPLLAAGVSGGNVGFALSEIEA